VNGSAITVPVNDVTELVDVGTAPNTNTFTILSVQDANGCYVVGSETQVGAPLGKTVDGSFPDELDDTSVDIDLYIRSETTALKTIVSTDICLLNDNDIQLDGDIAGTITTGKWTKSGTGTFSPNEFALNAVYTMSLADIALGEVTFTLTADSPSLPNPCVATEDVVTYYFTTNSTANAGPDRDICLSDPYFDISGIIGGGASAGIWTTTLIDGSTPTQQGYFGTPGSGSGPTSTTDLLTTYNLSQEEIDNGGVIIILTTTDGTCALPGDSPNTSDEAIIRIGTNPSISNNTGYEYLDLCLGDKNTIYKVNGPSTNNYTWTLPANASLISGDGTKQIIVDWDDNTSGVFTIIVQETSSGIGCYSNEEFIDVTVHASPTVELQSPSPGIRSFEKLSPNIPLEGVPHPAIPNPFPQETESRRDSLFYGPGVIVDQDGSYFFDPDVAGALATHDIIYQYTDDYGCTNELLETFSVVDASSSIVIVDNDNDPNNDVILYDEYCEDYPVVNIRISSTFVNTPGYSIYKFSGPGITNNPDGTADFNPLLAADPTGTGANRIGGFKTIEYTQYTLNIDGDTVVIPWGEQQTIVNLVPTLAPDALPQGISNLNPISGVYCSNEEPFILTRDRTLNPNNSFRFSVIGGDPYGLITEGVGLAGPEFTLNPFNEFNPTNSDYDPDDFTGHIIEIEYYYEYFYEFDPENNPGEELSCNDIVIIPITIYQRPPAPESAPVFGCDEGLAVPDLTVNNPVPGATIRWYDNPNLNGVPVQGATFTSGVTALGTTNFYVTQEINGCESIATEVGVTVTTVNESEVSFTTGPACTEQNTQFNSFYDPSDVIIGGTIVEWLWNFDDINAVVGTEISTLENPTHSYAEPGDYNVSLTVTNDAGCAATIDNVVTVGEIPQPEFTFTAIAAEKPSEFRNETPALLNSTIAEAKWTFENWDGTLIHEENITDPTLIYEPYQYTFLTEGKRRVTLTVTTDKNCINSITKEFFIVPFVPVTDVTFDFNTSTEGWISWGLDNPESEWVIGTPSGSFDDGQNRGQVWYTVPNDQGSDEDIDFSIVYSPCFDISSLVRPVVTLNTFADTQDGTIIQYTNDFITWKTLGREESGIDWYNVEFVNTLQEFPSNGEGAGWQETNTGWKESKHSLTEISSGLDQVIFRFIFRGTTGTGDESGFAFDNFQINDRDRIVLLEHFENSTSSTDLSFINDFGDVGDELNTTELVKIQYRTGFGGTDAVYDENQSDVNARALFYNINSANRAVMDGDNSETDLFSTWGNRVYGTKSLTSPKLEFVDISISQNPSNGEMDFSIKLKATREDLGKFIVHVAIVENP
jgi:hypothetical protein